jgi:hypothetical protein
MVAPSSFLLIAKEGDPDGIFSKVASKNKVPLVLVDKLADLQTPLKSIFEK